MKQTQSINDNASQRGRCESEVSKPINVWGDPSRLLHRAKTEEKRGSNKIAANGALLTDVPKSAPTPVPQSTRTDWKRDGGTQEWSSTLHKSKPKCGYSCKRCGKLGGEPDSHWFQLCPNKSSQHSDSDGNQHNIVEDTGSGMSPNNSYNGSVLSSPTLARKTSFSPPKKGYVCKFCNKHGGESDSHWFQQCPFMAAHEYQMQMGYDPAAIRQSNMMVPSSTYCIMYAHQAQLYYLQAMRQQMATLGVDPYSSTTGCTTGIQASGGMTSPALVPCSPSTYDGNPYFLYSQPGVTYPLQEPQSKTDQAGFTQQVPLKDNEESETLSSK